MKPESVPAPITLNRTLTLPMVVLYGLGVTIGAGIYVLVGEAAGRAGMSAPLSFIIAGLIMICLAASFAELAGRLPFAAGEARFVEEAFSGTGLRLLSALPSLASASGPLPRLRLARRAIFYSLSASLTASL